MSQDSEITSGPGRSSGCDRTQQPTRPAHAATVVELDYRGGRRWWRPPSRRWSGSCCGVTMVDSKHRSSSTRSAPAGTLVIGTGKAVAPLLTTRRKRYTELTPYGLVALFLLPAR